MSKVSLTITTIVDTTTALSNQDFYKAINYGGLKDYITYTFIDQVNESSLIQLDEVDVEITENDSFQEVQSEFELFKSIVQTDESKSFYSTKDIDFHLMNTLLNFTTKNGLAPKGSDCVFITKEGLAMATNNKTLICFDTQTPMVDSVLTAQILGTVRTDELSVLLTDNGQYYATVNANSYLDINMKSVANLKKTLINKGEVRLETFDFATLPHYATEQCRGLLLDFSITHAITHYHINADNERIYLFGKNFQIVSVF